MITNKNDVKAMMDHISCDCKCKFNSTVCNSNQKWNNNKQCNKYYSWYSSIYICENSKYLKSTSVTECDKIISAMDIVSTKKTNVTSTTSINCHGIKVKDFYILHTVLLVIILHQ